MSVSVNACEKAFVCAWNHTIFMRGCALSLVCSRKHSMCANYAFVTVCYIVHNKSANICFVCFKRPEREKKINNKQ